MEGVRRRSCMREAERLEVSGRHQRGHFISHRTINYIPPPPLYEFVALVQRLQPAGEGRRLFVVLQPGR